MFNDRDVWLLNEPVRGCFNPWAWRGCCQAECKPAGGVLAWEENLSAINNSLSIAKWMS